MGIWVMNKWRALQQTRYTPSFELDGQLALDLLLLDRRNRFTKVEMH